MKQTVMKTSLVTERKKLLRSIERLLEGPMTLLGFLWLVLLIIELVWGLSDLLQYLSLAIWAIFIIDFLIKFLLAPQKITFFKANWLTAISLIIPALRVFRIFRLLRLFRGVRLIKVVASINRSMRSLAATMKRRGFAYVFLLTIVVTFGGAAGMYAIERNHPGFENFGMALWWTSMRVITAGSDFWPSSAEGRCLAFIISLFGYAVFGYVTATLATFFIGRDAEEKDAPVAGSGEIAALKELTIALNKKIDELNTRLTQN